MCVYMHTYISAGSNSALCHGFRKPSLLFDLPVDYIYIYIYVCMHIYVCRYMCACVCVCVYMYTYISAGSNSALRHGFRKRSLSLSTYRSGQGFNPT